jgi:hypothetical protein
MVSGFPYSQDFLAAKRLKGDLATDTFVQNIFADSDSKTDFYQRFACLCDNGSLAAFQSRYPSEHFISNAGALPYWADRKLLQNGSAFFVKHAELIMQLLGLLSLPYCYAAADGAMVLYLSQRLKSDAHKRLLDTSDFIWNVMAPNAFEAKGNGLASSLKIRFTHAFARYYTLKNGRWNDALGVPVNQEDMAGTNLAFSLIVIRGLRKLGRSVTYQDQHAFLHLWAVIGYLLGLDDDLIPRDGKAANQLEGAIRARQFRSSAQGQELVKSLLLYFKEVMPANVSERETIRLMRYLLGEEIAALLGLPETDIPAYLSPMVALASNLPQFSSTSSIEVSYREKLQAFKKQQLW